MPEPYSSQFTSRSYPRTWTRQSFIPFRLEVLSPVTISPGEDFSPLAYVIRKEKENVYALHLVDTKAWLVASQGEKDISAALEEGKILNLRRLMHEQLDENLYSLGRVPISQPGTALQLIKHIVNPKSLSQAEVQPFIRSPSTMAPFVPGSSIKGALSTPLIDYLDHGALKAAAQHNKFGYTKTMEQFFGKISDHSMQGIKVSDIPVPENATEIMSAVEVRLQPNKTGTPKIPCEALTPTPKEGRPLYGRLFMEMQGGQPRITLMGGKTISLEELSTICYEFYSARFQREFAKFYKLTHLSHIGKNLLEIQKRIESVNPQREILLRLGHYTHIECMTVTENAPSFKKGFGKTRTLADQKLPFGWIILRYCEQKEYSEGLKKVEDAIISATQKRERERTERENTLAKALEEQRKLAEAAAQAKALAEEEKKKKEQEKAEREAKLANLSPQERAIAEVLAEDATEAQSMTLFAQLATIPPDLQKKAAEALQTCWKRLGKWDGKLSKKQKEKVTAVKALLK